VKCIDSVTEMTTDKLVAVSQDRDSSDETNETIFNYLNIIRLSNNHSLTNLRMRVNFFNAHLIFLTCKFFYALTRYFKTSTF